MTPNPEHPKPIGIRYDTEAPAGKVRMVVTWPNGNRTISFIPKAEAERMKRGDC